MHSRGATLSPSRMTHPDPAADLARRLIAHRGWSSRYPENTLASVRGALEIGAKAVEIDVQISRDGVPFLFHDRTLQRLCGVPGSLAERSAAELERLHANDAERFGELFGREPLARLEAFVALLHASPGVQAFVELKRAALEAHGRERALDLVLPVLKPLRDQAVLISFDVPVLEAARARGDWPIGPVFDRWGLEERARAAALAPAFVFCDVDGLGDAPSIDPACGELAVYEVADLALAQQLLARGASRIETFAVGELLEQLGAARRAPSP